MSTVITEAKDVGETVQISLEFLSRLRIGETLGTCTASISVLSGIDASPNSMLQGLPSIIGTSVSQVVKGGVLGNIYLLSLAARTSLNNIYVQETAIAIPSNNITVLP